MIQLQAKPPSTRRSFENAWGELDYLCKKIRFWLYTRQQISRANRYLDRLDRVLRSLPDNDVAIIRHEALALRAELKSEIDEAIAHRRKEIALMERLHKEANSPRCSPRTRAYMLRDRDEAALRDRQAVLESLQGQMRQRVNGR